MYLHTVDPRTRQRQGGWSLALVAMRNWWPPRPRAGCLQGLVLNLGLQVVQDRLRRRTNVVDVDQVVHEPPHQLILRWSRNRNLAGCPCISSANRRHGHHLLSYLNAGRDCRTKAGTNAWALWALTGTGLEGEASRTRRRQGSPWRWRRWVTGGPQDRGPASRKI